MVFGFFGKKKPILNLEPKQEVEIEFTGDEQNSFFTHVLEIQKKKIILKTPQKDNQFYPSNVGDSIAITYLKDKNIYHFKSKILEKRDREIDIATPSEITEEKNPCSLKDFNIEIPIPIQFRAINTAHLQRAITKELSSKGIKVITNLPIPVDTELYIEFEIPNSPLIKTKGRVAISEKLPQDTRKSLTEIEFQDPACKDSKNLFHYAIFYYYRRKRRDHIT